MGVVSAPGFTQAQSRRRAVLDKLGRGIRAGRVAPVSASPPTIGTEGTTSAITGTHYGFTGSEGLFTFLRASWALAGGGYPLYMFMRALAVHSTPGGAVGGGSAPLVRFWSDAPDIEIANRGATGGYRLYVDGELVQQDRLSHLAATGPHAWTRFTWGDGGESYRKPRLYEVEGAGDLDFGGVKIGNTSKLWPAPLTDLDLRVIVHGDSHTERSIPRYLAQLLGQPDTRGTAVGATGFVDNNGGAKYKFVERVAADVIAPAPDVVIELGGVNDAGDTTEANIRAAVNLWLDTVQAALPNTPIFMTGPMSPGTNFNTGDNATVRNAKRDACAGRANVFFIDNLAEAWVTGTGKVGATAGNGNADWVTDTDGAHLTDLMGGRYIAERVVRGMLPLIDAALAG